MFQVCCISACVVIIVLLLLLRMSCCRAGAQCASVSPVLSVRRADVQCASARCSVCVRPMLNVLAYPSCLSWCFHVSQYAEDMLCLTIVLLVHVRCWKCWCCTYFQLKVYFWVSVWSNSYWCMERVLACVKEDCCSVHEHSQNFILRQADKHLCLDPGPRS